MTSPSRLGGVLLALSFGLLIRGCGDDGGMVGPDGGDDPCVVDPTGPGCTPDMCTAETCSGERRECVMVEGMPTCRCEPGTHDEGGACVPDTECTDTSCNGHGLCSVVDEMLSCECELGYTGPACGECDEGMGFLPDGEGGCDADLCDPNPCAEGERSRCEVIDGTPVCACPAGTHAEGEDCVPDESCSPTSCGGHGTCTDDGMVVSCACEPGWAEPFCGECDEMAGYHPDGMGGCTMDACLPNPCVDPLQTVCVETDGVARCECDAGAHMEGTSCVPDETCETVTCDGHGECSVADGVTECACDPGYTGDDCSTCDTDFHPDGMGGCTMDACLPNPCTDPNRGECSDVGGSAVCDCDPGYHEDGVGGCTDDPCLPDLCVGMNQACRPDGMGSYECYTPACDDMNPCTDDAVVGGSCTYTPRSVGAACSTTVCLAGQTCDGTATCTGGTAVVCDDANPCTADSCDSVMGCEHTVDDALVPDDGIACTTDSCSGGVASNVADDMACDDGLWCNGIEICSPAAPGADTDGCLATAVPTPPERSTPCRQVLACDEATDSFPLMVLAAGAACDDGLSCTSGDMCATTGGACVGTVMDTCPWTTCDSPDALESTIDIPIATITGTVTLAGAPLPATDVDAYNYGEPQLSLVARDTGTRHTIHWVDYISGANLASGADTIGARVVPGIYDLRYRRDHNRSSSGDEWVDEARDIATYPTGDRILQADVVIGPGANVLDVDIPVATISGTVTLGGAALPATDVDAYNYGEPQLSLVARDTGTRHTIHWVDYVSGANLASGADTIGARVPPGTYDLLYRRDHNRSSSGDEWVDEARDIATYPTGDRILQSGVVLTAGANVLDVDIPVATITGMVTLDGAALPATDVDAYNYGEPQLSLVARDTGTRHTIHWVDYISGANLASGADTIGARLPPGTYDLLYRRDKNRSSSGDEWVDEARDIATYPTGDRILMTDIVLTAGANTLNVDIPVATITGTVTLAGAALPATDVDAYNYGEPQLSLVARDTGTRHTIHWVDYISGANLASGADTIGARVPPGTYDLLYRRDHNRSSSGDEWVDEARDIATYPTGDRILQSGIVLTAGSNTLNVDIPVATLTGTVTLDGAPLPTPDVDAYNYGEPQLSLVAHDTGTRHTIHWVDYISGANLASGADTIGARVPPGIYDLLYRRDHNRSSSGDEWVDESRDIATYPTGDRILVHDIVLTAGSNTLNVDIPGRLIAGTLTLGGEALPTHDVDAYNYGEPQLSLVSRDTGTRHTIHWVDYISGANLASGADTIGARLPPGTYDLRYRRDHNRSSSGDEWVDESRDIATYPTGDRYLAQCIVIP